MKTTLRTLMTCQALILANLVFVQPTAAKSQTTQSQNAEKAQVLQLIKKHVEVSACTTTLDKNNYPQHMTDIDDVYQIERDKKRGSVTYFVLWGGDMGCDGGSGTWSYHVSTVEKQSSYKPFMVINDRAFGSALSADINFRFLESMKQLSADTFEIISWNYADDKYGGKDAGNNFPANKFKYTVQYQKGQWQVSKQVLLEQNK